MTETAQRSLPFRTRPASRPVHAPPDVQATHPTVTFAHPTQTCLSTKNPASHLSHPRAVTAAQCISSLCGLHPSDVSFNQKASSQTVHPVLVHFVQLSGHSTHSVPLLKNPDLQIAHPDPLGIGC